MTLYTDAYIVTLGDLHAIGATITCVYPPEGAV
jgi:hypothetical protein